MSSPGKQHVPSEESTDSGKIYGRVVCYVHKELISNTQKKVKLLAASEIKCCKRCHPQPRIKVVILSGEYLGLWGGGDT
jgi:hypothetical protein